MNHLTAMQARAFAEKWLPAWTGNSPELLEYFQKLLASNPDWVWSQIEGIPMQDGFLNKWLARIPVGSRTLEIVGVCFVQLDAAGKIRRNEVYFDRSSLLAEIAALKRGAAQT